MRHVAFPDSEVAVERKIAISLSKALKLKNRLAGRLRKMEQQIATYNSVLEGRQGEVNVAELDKLASQTRHYLVILKALISEANRGIQGLLIELGEKKAEAEFLSGLNTRHGSEPGYQGQTFTYIATIQKADVEKRVKQLEKEIDDLQDRVDSYNAVPERLHADARVLELAS
jgi:hypothetical protein